MLITSIKTAHTGWNCSYLIDAPIRALIMYTYSRRYRLTNCFGDLNACIIAEGRRDDKISWTRMDGRRLGELLFDVCEWKLSDGFNSSGLALIVTCNWPKLLAEPLFSLLGRDKVFPFSSPSVSLTSSVSDNRPSRVEPISLLHRNI